MWKKARAIAMAFMAMGSGTAFAGDVSSGVITNLAINKIYGEVLFVKVNATKNNTPTCHANGSWSFVLPLTSELDKKIYAMILAARASQTPISITGTGACDLFGSIETMNGFFDY